MYHELGDQIGVSGIAGQKTCLCIMLDTKNLEYRWYEEPFDGLLTCYLSRCLIILPKDFLNNGPVTRNVQERFFTKHYYDLIMGAMASEITSLTIVYSTVHSDADQSKHQSSASLAFVRGIHRSPPVTRKMFPFDDVIMTHSPKNLAISHREISNISRTLVGDKIVDHSDVFVASPVGAAPTTSSFSS